MQPWNDIGQFFSWNRMITVLVLKSRSLQRERAMLSSGDGLLKAVALKCLFLEAVIEACQKSLMPRV